jgi:hypothetical protein
MGPVDHVGRMAAAVGVINYEEWVGHGGMEWDDQGKGIKGS